MSKKVAVIPYLHTISHNLKKIGQMADVSVEFFYAKQVAAITYKN